MAAKIMQHETRNALVLCVRFTIDTFIYKGSIRYGDGNNVP